MPKILISYRRADSDNITGRIHDRLEPHFGRSNVFLDIDNIPFGVDFREYLDAAVGQCDILLAIIGDDWLNARYHEGPKTGQRRLDDAGDYVRIEIEAAIVRNIPVIPVLVGKATMPAEQELPDSMKKLAYHNAAEVRSGRDFRDHVDRLIRGIDYLLKHRTNPIAETDKLPAREIVINSPPTPAPVLPLEIANSIGMKFMLIPAGTFLMGSPDGEGSFDEHPQHEVEITRPFYMGVFQVTHGQYQCVMGSNPSYFCSSGGAKSIDTALFPVEKVSWEEARGFCDALSKLSDEKKVGRHYRLPTEAEWEYACRGGANASSPYSFGATVSPEQANFDQSNLGRPCPVGSFPANDFGLFDMHGNVWEWCLDWYDASYYQTSPKRDPQGPEDGDRRVLRGGAWECNSDVCRSAYRYSNPPSVDSSIFGFRVVLLLNLPDSVERSFAT